MYSVKMDKQETPDNPAKPGFIVLYLIEISQAFVAILIIKIAMEKPIRPKQLLLESMAIGALTYILEQYSPEYNASIRQGMTFSVGSQLMARQFI